MAKHFCHFCHMEIDPDSVRQGTVTIEATVWITQRRNNKGRYFTSKRTGRMAHNPCAEAAYTKGKVLGQVEMFEESQ